MDVLAKRVADLKVGVRCDARAVALMLDAGNRVVGLVVRSEGRDQFVRALKGVILCAGGFIMNQTLVRQHAPHLARANTPIGTVDDGSGIQLGQSVGAHAIHMNEGFVTLPWYPDRKSTRLTSSH